MVDDGVTDSGRRPPGVRHVQQTVPRTCVDCAELRGRRLDGTGPRRRLVTQPGDLSAGPGDRRRARSRTRGGPCAACRERRLLRAQRRRRRCLRRRPACAGRAESAGAGAVEPAGRALLGAVRVRDDCRRVRHHHRRRQALVLAVRRVQPGPHRAARLCRSARTARRDDAGLPGDVSGGDRSARRHRSREHPQCAARLRPAPAPRHRAPGAGHADPELGDAGAGCIPQRLRHRVLPRRGRARLRP